MSELRLFGQEVQVRIIRAGALVTEISAIKSFVFETRHRIISEGYLGETALRQDEIFDEVGGSFEVNPEGPDILRLQRLIVERSSRRTANPEQVSATFRATFPNQAIVRVTIPDMKFDPIPFNVAQRDAYVGMNFTYKATSYILST